MVEAHLLEQDNIFKWRQYEPTIILLCVRWSLRYSLSYRDLGEMMAERGLHVGHTMIYRSRSALCPRMEAAWPGPTQTH